LDLFIPFEEHLIDYGLRKKVIWNGGDVEGYKRGRVGLVGVLNEVA
jgi:hypothetical protein